MIKIVAPLLLFTPDDYAILFGGRYYQFFGCALSWQEAERSCQRQMKTTSIPIIP